MSLNYQQIYKGNTATIICTVYSPSVGAVTIITCKNFSKYGYCFSNPECWIIWHLSVPMGARLKEFHFTSKISPDSVSKWRSSTNTAACCKDKTLLHKSMLCYGLVHCVNWFASQHLTSREADVHLLIILFSKSENLSVAPAAVNTVIMKWFK